LLILFFIISWISVFISDNLLSNPWALDIDLSLIFLIWDSVIFFFLNKSIKAFLSLPITVLGTFIAASLISETVCIIFRFWLGFIVGFNLTASCISIKAWLAVCDIGVAEPDPPGGGGKPLPGSPPSPPNSDISYFSAICIALPS